MRTIDKSYSRLTSGIRNRKTIHTTISDEEYKQLLIFGKGKLKRGISNLLKIVKHIPVHVTIETNLERVER